MSCSKISHFHTNIIKGKTIAVVYIFENENEPGFDHYWVWKSNIISGWLIAIQEIECVPLILDVRTFVHKAINCTLPHVDYVVNLNCGSRELSSMSLVPSMCSFLSVPCIPCNAASIVTAENKKISNLLAEAVGLRVPRNLEADDPQGIYRPLNLGSSIGVRRGPLSGDEGDGVYQEFIPGYDVTIPIVYNPSTCDIDLLPSILYVPKSLNPNWFYDAEEKEKDDNFTTIPIAISTAETRKSLIDFARIFPIQTYGRIDARLICREQSLLPEIYLKPLSNKDLYFIEINAMPTIEKSDSFEFSLEFASNDKTNSFYDCANEYKDFVSVPTINGFLLACSMISLFKARY